MDKLAPPSFLLDVGTPLPPGEALPTLFRYPGACGVRDLFGPGLQRLGAPETPLLWCADRPLHGEVGGARHFGTVALLQPRLARPVRARPGIFVGVNLPAAELGPLVWVPPSALLASLPWERLLDPRFPGLREERLRVEDALGAYLSEIDALRRAGAPPPIGPWIEVPAVQRLARLRAAGVAPRFTLAAAA
jgi:hypothetical protein